MWEFGIQVQVRSSAPIGASSTGTAGGSAEQSSSPGGLGATAARSECEEVQLVDTAKREVYVCFEWPLGVPLKAEVRETTWKGDYVEIFSLLPLEKCNLDQVKPDENKKEEEECRRYRLIPYVFQLVADTCNPCQCYRGEGA